MPGMHRAAVPFQRRCLRRSPARHGRPCPGRTHRDLRNYHDYIAWAWLDGRDGVDLAAAQEQTWFNLLLWVPHYVAARIAARRGPHVLLVRCKTKSSRRRCWMDCDEGSMLRRARPSSTSCRPRASRRPGSVCSSQAPVRRALRIKDRCTAAGPRPRCAGRRVACRSHRRSFQCARCTGPMRPNLRRDGSR